MVKLKRQRVRGHRRKKESTARITRPNIAAILKFIFAIILLGAIGIGLERLKYMFVDSDYFEIKGVDVKLYDQNGSLEKVTLGDITDGKAVGRNIFLMDLVDLKEKIESAHPEFKDVIIRRALPNKLIVQVKKRKGVAVMRADKFYLIDDDGVLLSGGKNVSEEDLPIISGISVSTAGSKLTDAKRQDLDRALYLIDAISINKKFSRFGLKAVDLTDSRSISFFLDPGNVEIKIGDSEFNKRLDMLAMVLEQLGPDIERVKYIDLRFEDPIVGPR